MATIKTPKAALMASAISISVLMAGAPAQAYGLGGDHTFRQPFSKPMPAPAPRYTPPAPRPQATQTTRPMPDLRPSKPQPANPNVVHFPPTPTPPPAPRFEGGGVAVPTPTGGGAGSLVVRDNKNNVTVEGHGRTEPGADHKVGGKVIINPPMGNPPQARSAEPEVVMPSER